ncbi:hypothetical protein [Micromonospora sp. NPDC005220]|uniref:hypothetical protein n=1 Tax=Micromonospora sp. NPDC005220 TaxID=3155589 RepID=UPI0033A07503
MPDSQTVDAFKFVAVRPPQLVGQREAALGLITDQRRAPGGGSLAGNDDGESTRHPDPRLAALAEAARALADHFGAQPGGDPLGDADADAELRDVRALADRDAAELAGTAWDALYRAYRQGPAAGPDLETPTAALRALHFAALWRADAATTAADAVTALGATPVVPAELAVVEAPETTRWRGSASVAGHAEVSDEPVRALLREVAATRTLLDAVRANAAPIRERVLSEEPTQHGDVFRNRITLGRVASMARIFDGNLPEEARSVAARLRIGEATAVPTATATAQTHLTTLLRRVDALRDDPALRREFRALSGTLDLHDVGTIAPGLDLSPIFDADPDPGTSPDVDVSGRIRPLGVGDLKVVKQTLLGYAPGEVAHIENVLKGEHRERVHRMLDRVETTYFESSEEVNETERDQQSTDRFELKKEADRTVKEDMSVQAGVTVTAAFGPVVTTAHGDFAYATSKQESTRSSSNFARDVVDRSVTKIQKKVKTERTTKTFHEVEETNTHGVDNAQGAAHITGVYRWVDKRYRAQVYNYGRRLMLEFIVPQPAAYWLASQLRPKTVVGAEPPIPLVNAKNQPLTAADLDESNYQTFASRYNAQGITTPPLEWTYAATSFEQSGVDNGKTVSKMLKDLVVPDGYTMIYYIANVSLIYVVGGPRFSIQIGDDAAELIASTAVKQGGVHTLGWAQSSETFDNPTGPMAVSCIGYDINAYSVNVGINCYRNDAHLQDWQNKTFEKISTAYLAMKTAYDQKVAQAGAPEGAVVIQGRNPATNREIERTELKKLCVTMMTGSHLSDYNAMTDPADAPAKLPEVDVYEAMAEGPVIQFFEQAFDWPQMTYLFYPYFWGRKTKWTEASNRSDIDPLFAQFKQAGAARVVVPVSPAYNLAVAYFLARRSPRLADRVWLGGEPPTIDDPLYKSVADEVRAQTDDLAGALPEGSPWEFTVPTTLVWLQEGPELPVYPA